MISQIRSPIRTGTATHIFTVTLHPGTSARDRQRCFRRMQRDLIHRGLIVNYCASDFGPTLCLAVKDHGARWRTDRHLYVDRVIDQPQTCHVSLLPSASLPQLIEDDGGILTTRDPRRSAGTPGWPPAAGPRGRRPDHPRHLPPAREVGSGHAARRPLRPTPSPPPGGRRQLRVRRRRPGAEPNTAATRDASRPEHRPNHGSLHDHTSGTLPCAEVTVPRTP